MSYQKYKSDMTTGGVGLDTGFDADDSKNNTRVSSAIMTVPYPTYRGALVFGFGFSRVYDFDRISNFFYREEEFPGDFNAVSEEVKETGGLNQWAFGCGLDLSPRVSFGGSLFLYHGKHELSLKSPLYISGALDSDFEQRLEYKYLGYGAKLGLSMQLSRYIGVGMTLESPVSLSVDEDGSEVENNVYVRYDEVEYDLKRPFVFAAGAVGRFDYFTFMADIEYTDWSQMSYSDNMGMELLNDELEEAYREVLKFKIGGEYVIPNIDLALRAGFFNNPLPYKETPSYESDSRYGYSVGFGFLVDQVLMIDVAYVHGVSGNNLILETEGGIFVNDIDFEEETTTDRLLMTASYRF